LTGHTDYALCLAFGPGGRTLASGGEGDDKTVKLWGIATGQVLLTMASHTNSVYSVAFSPDGRTLASGSADHTIKLWDVATGQLLRTLGAPADATSYELPVTSPVVSPAHRPGAGAVRQESLEAATKEFSHNL
jgi:WD40 repeat protein